MIGVRVRVLPLAEKKCSSETLLAVSDPRVRDRSRGGGVSDTGEPRRGPLDIVTGAGSPMGTPAARLRPKPRPGRASRARRTADANSSSRSASELVRRRELIRLGGITRGSACGRYVWCEMALSSIARTCPDATEGRRDSELEPDKEMTSARSAPVRGSM